MSALDKLSLVIPTRSEERNWMTLLSDLRSLPDSTEIIIVGPDLHSTQTFESSVAVGPKVIFCNSKLGRAEQLNTGASAATGKFIWFLHGDSRVPSESISALNITLESNSKVALYYFHLRFLKDGPKLMILNEIGANLRSSLFDLPFGDQGFCIERSVFNKLGGFDEDVRYGEDHLFVWSCKKSKILISPINAVIFTSARKYQELGWLKTSLSHIFLTVFQALEVLIGRVRSSRNKFKLEPK